MISIYNLKPRFQKALRPLLCALYHLRITPNMITLYGILLSLFVGVSVWLHIGKYSLLLLPLGLLFRMMLNALDGMMASTYNLKSKKGELLNEFGDVLSDLFMYIPLIKVSNHTTVIFVFILMAVLNEFAGVLSKAITGTRRYDGPMGKSDRALFVGLYAVLVFIGVPLVEYTNLIFLAASCLILLSTMVRLKKTIE